YSIYFSIPALTLSKRLLSFFRYSLYFFNALFLPSFLGYIFYNSSKSLIVAETTLGVAVGKVSMITRAGICSYTILSLSNLILSNLCGQVPDIWLSFGIPRVKLLSIKV